MTAERASDVSEWHPLETLPEKTMALLYCPRHDITPFQVDMFKWVEYSEWETMSESSGKSGARRQIRQEKITREREFGHAWGVEFWMPLPEPPARPAT